MVSSNCNLFRVFQICVNIVLVIIKNSLFVLDSNDEAKCVKICSNAV